jgi:hypothetical protein
MKIPDPVMIINIAEEQAKAKLARDDAAIVAKAASDAESASASKARLDALASAEQEISTAIGKMAPIGALSLSVVAIQNADGTISVPMGVDSAAPLHAFTLSRDHARQLGLSLLGLASK